MNTKLVLTLSALILAIVAATMGDDGAVGRLAEGKARHEPMADSETENEAADDSDRAAAPIFSAFVPLSTAPADAPLASTAIPVYEYRPVHIDIPQEIVNPQEAASSPIR